MSRKNKLLPGEFYPDEGQWHPAFYPETNVNLSSLRLLTFNIWFGEHYLKKRIQAIIKILQESDADVIALQEINYTSLQIILNNKWIREHYWISDISGSTFSSYGVALLSRIPINSLHLYPLTSDMDRHVLVAEFLINEQRLLVGTVHLESLKFSEEFRVIQLHEIFNVLAQSDHSVLMGDFNFCSSWDENSNIDKAYSDFWAVLRPNEHGYTEDTDINTMRKQLKREEKKVRFDRIISRSYLPGWNPQRIKRIGMKPISAEQPDIFPSDHFGLLGVLEWHEK